METGFVTTAPALTRYQKARGVDPGRRVGDGSKRSRSEVWRRVEESEDVGVAETARIIYHG